MILNLMALSSAIPIGGTTTDRTSWNISNGWPVKIE
jgi:hypothetical protein